MKLILSGWDMVHICILAEITMNRPEEALHGLLTTTMVLYMAGLSVMEIIIGISMKA